MPGLPAGFALCERIDRNRKPVRLDGVRDQEGHVGTAPERLNDVRHAR
ncbi:hypothetical protein J2X68_007548 [Streptomyces sp. 3330]|nr:hypothetical protein [Streptomyces sp. 3330]